MMPTLVVYTFRRRQSSDCCMPLAWGQLGPSSVASKTFCQSFAGIGGYTVISKHEIKNISRI